MANYIVETGTYRKTIKEAGSLEGAIKSAFILYPPKNPGILTRVRLQKANLKSKEGVWNYVDTKIMLTRCQ